MIVLLILAFDTSSKSASVAVCEDDFCLAEINVNNGLTHSQSLMPMISQALELSTKSIDDIDAIAVTIGPGSFTGLRIAISTAKGLAMGKNLPIFPVSTLKALAYNNISHNGNFATVLDARCSQVYSSIYNIKSNKVTNKTPDDAMKIDDFFALIQIQNIKNITFIGDGADVCMDRYNDLVKNEGITFKAKKLSRNESTVKASSIALACHYEKIDFIDYHELCASYIRIPQAQRNLLKGRE